MQSGGLIAKPSNGMPYLISPPSSLGEFILVQNWFEEIEHLVPID